MSKRNQITLVLLIVPLFISHALGSCISKPVEKTVIVDACEVVDPSNVSQLNDLAKQPQGSVRRSHEEIQESIERVRESYQGAVLVEKQTSKIEKYFVSSKDRRICERFKKGNAVRALVAVACCDGDPNPPCYLGSSVTLLKFSRDSENKFGQRWLEKDLRLAGKLAGLLLSRHSENLRLPK